MSSAGTSCLLNSGSLWALQLCRTKQERQGCGPGTPTRVQGLGRRAVRAQDPQLQGLGLEPSLFSPPSKTAFKKLLGQRLCSQTPNAAGLALGTGGGRVGEEGAGLSSSTEGNSNKGPVGTPCPSASCLQTQRLPLPPVPSTPTPWERWLTHKIQKIKGLKRKIKITCKKEIQCVL